MEKLSADQLSKQVHSATLGFESTAELDDFGGILGQPRATKALDFGVAIDQPGYNIYIAGESGSSRFRYILDYFQILFLNPISFVKNGVHYRHICSSLDKG